MSWEPPKEIFVHDGGWTTDRRSFWQVAYTPSSLAQEMAERAREEGKAEVAAMRAVIQQMRKHCLCDRHETRGFDYGEEHAKLGKPGMGKRWLTPADLADVYLLNTREVTLASSKPSPRGVGKNGERK